MPEISDKPWLIFLLACNLLAPVAQAFEVHYGLGYAAEYTTNIYRVPVDAESEWTNISTAFLNAEDAGDRYLYEIDGEVEYREYQNDAYEDELLKSGGLYSDVTLWRRNLNWITENQLTPVRTSSNNPDTPVNRQETNVFSTGPDLNLNLGEVNDLFASGRYVDIREENLPDSKQGTAELSLSRRISPVEEISITGEYIDQGVEEICINCEDYLNDPLFVGYAGFYDVNSFVEKEAFIGYERSWPRLLMNFEVGQVEQEILLVRDIILPNTMVIQELYDQESTDDVYRVSGNYRVNSNSMVLFNLARETSTSSEQILEQANEEVIDPATGQAIDIELPADAIVTSSPFLDKSVNLDWSRSGRNSDFLVGISGHRRDYFGDNPATEDEKSRGASFDFNYSFSDTLSLNQYIEWNRVEFVVSERVDHFAEYGVGLDFSMYRILTLNFDVFRTTQRSTDDSQEFEANTLLLSFTYEPTRAR